MTVAEVFIRQADFLGAEQKGNPPGLKLLADRAASRFVEVAHGLLQCSIAHRSRAHDQSTVSNRLGNGLIFFGLL